MGWWKTDVWTPKTRSALKIIGTIGGVIGAIVATIGLFNIVKAWWTQLTITWVATTCFAVDWHEPPREGGSREARHVTMVAIRNRTALQLHNVMVKMPVKGRVAILDGDKVMSISDFSGRIDHPAIRPHTTLTVAVHHKEKWKRGNLIEISTEETDIFSGEPVTGWPDDTASPRNWYKVGFIVLLMPVAVFLIVRGGIWLRRKSTVSGRTAEGTNPSLIAATGT